MDEEYRSFQKELKRYIHLELLIKVLGRDRQQLSELKMAKIYLLLLDSIMDRIIKD
ncbi:hypothetical protein [Risungbinella massiliensis]|uniref:hypothetical protein n=1 Tax=Risungbinella massiliensis TaxID=1329796 RepID=UPI0012B60C71|nr:hypothetical protein [Risungbinella massiliensis]